jgi:hypothetical protein
MLEFSDLHLLFFNLEMLSPVKIIAFPMLINFIIREDMTTRSSNEFV